MSDTEKLAEAMKELAAAMRHLADKLPGSGGGGGITVWHQHQYPQAVPSYWFSGGGAGGGYYSGNT